MSVSIQRSRRKGPAPPLATPTVLLLRDVPEEQRLSMERFADALEKGFSQIDGFRVQAFAVHQPRVAARVGLGSLDGYFARFIHYPIAAGRQGADLYHIVDQGYAHLLSRLPPERTIVTCHDVFLLVAEQTLTELRGRRTSVLRFRWSTSYLRRAAHVVCVSAETRADLSRLCGVPKERTSVIPNGVDERFRPLEQAVAQRIREDLVGPSRRALLHVSSGVGYKNVKGTLDVLAALRQASVDAVLVRVGVPLTPEEGTHARHLGVADAVIECGRVNDNRLVELYNACEVLLFPSFYEGFGWPPLEAMACGTPVVTSTHPAIRELVGDASLQAEAGDVDGLARAVRSILASSDVAADLRDRGLVHAAQFTWERAVARYADVYESVLACAA